MVASPCLIEQPKNEAEKTERFERNRRFELGTPGSAAAPMPAAFSPGKISVPEARPVGSSWSDQQCQTWDILVAAMWRGLL